MWEIFGFYNLSKLGPHVLRTTLVVPVACLVLEASVELSGRKLSLIFISACSVDIDGTFHDESWRTLLLFQMQKSNTRRNQKFATGYQTSGHRTRSKFRLGFAITLGNDKHVELDSICR